MPQPSFYAALILPDTNGMAPGPYLSAATDAAINTPLDEIGNAGALIDWTCMRHQTQYTRLFRS